MNDGQYQSLPFACRLHRRSYIYGAHGDFYPPEGQRPPGNHPQNLDSPLGMSTGFAMFVVPEVRFPWWWAVTAFLVGWFIFAYPLIRSTKFEEREGLVYAQRSKSFAFILLGLLLVRTLLHEFINRYVSVPQSGGLFFILAFGMILHWRLFMYRHYTRMLPAKTELPQS